MALEAEAGRREALESRLRQAHKLEALGTFAGGVAHDFNNLLVPLLADAEALVAEGVPGSRARDSARRIEQAAVRARELVHGILAFSRGEGGALEPVPLAPLMEEVARLLEASTPDNVRVTVAVDPSTPPLLGDPTLLHQVLVNLVTNARLALPERGGEVRLEAYPGAHPGEDAGGPGSSSGRPESGTGSVAVVRVIDTGVGMDEATRQRAFDPFFTTRGAGKGTGLGLSTVLGTVRTLGGDVHLESTPGQGTTVELRFPGADVHPAASPVPSPGPAAPVSPAPPVPHPEPRLLRVLLVDDDRMVRAATSRMLARIGHAVTEAPGAREALEALESGEARHEHVDVVLTDRTMPDMDGIALARLVNERWPGLPVVLVTGDLHGAGRPGSDRDPSAPTFAAVLPKPFRRDELARTLQEAAGRDSPGAGRGNSPPDRAL
jgi:two-component system, cell cycle sensor histidine kinase and response regulator CckA